MKNGPGRGVFLPRILFALIGLVASAAVAHAATAAAPTFSPVAGTYTSAQTVTITSTTSGASINYTTDGTTPSATAGTLYSGKVSIGATTTLKAIAFKTGFNNSTVTSGTYTINLPTAVAPTFSPAAGAFNNAQTVKISSTTGGASINYTTDGTAPSATAGTPYSGPVSIGVTTMLKAIAFKDGFKNSTVTSGTYTLTAAAPTFSPAAGTYTSAQMVTISSTTSGASINYTTDGTTPSATAGTLYSGQVSIGATTTLKAISFKAGFNNSTVTSGTYTINLPTAVAPTFSPAAGAFNNAQTVKISSTTGGASINYTTDGTTPSATAGTPYSGPVSIGVTTMLKAIAFKEGFKNSPVTSGTYTLTAAAPTFSPAAGTYTSAQMVTISSTTSGASINYTTDGTTPSPTAGTLYSGQVSIGATTTLKAIAFKPGFNNSTVTSGVYTINLPTAAAPVFSPVAGTYTSVQTVTITSATSGASINYTTDGTTPSATAGMPYSGKVSIGATTTLKAIAFKAGFKNSPVTSGTYTLNLPTAAAPTFSPAAGTYTSAQTVTISSTTSGASINYTTDGSTPSATAGTLYSGRVIIGATTTLKAIAFKTGFNNSTVTSGTYTINLPPTVTLTAPASGALFVAPASITLTATAASSGGTITKVEFYQGSTLLGTATTAPYQFNWVNVPAGNYALTAEAYNNTNESTVSQVVNIVVDAPPAVSLTTPAKNAVFVAPAAITLAATATSSSSTISKVEFYQGTTLLGTATTAPYQFNWSNVAAGNYTLTAKAYDHYNVSTMSSPVAIIVDQAPTVSLTAPANHAVFAAPATIMLTAAANSSGGTISNVNFYQGTTLLGTVTTAPYQFNWTNVAAGAYTLTAVATDNLNVSTTSSVVNIIADTPPTVTLTAPTASAVIAPSATVTLTATAGASNNGTIGKVDFYQGTTLLGTATAPVAGQPGTFSFQLSAGLPAGNYTLTATATDSLGIATTSSPIAITADVPPTVALTSPMVDATFVMPSPIVLMATASASAGETISTVEFFYGSTSLGLGTPASGQPGTYLLTLASGLSPGAYDLTVVATDNLNVSTTSSPVSISVVLDQPPTITPINPSPTFSSSDNVSVSFDASDAVGPVANVEVYRNGVLDGTLTSPTSGSNSGPNSSATWTFTETSPLPPGTYTYVGVAHDNYGGTTTSAPVTVTVLPSLPYLTDFESSEGYNLGSLNQQLGWIVPQGSALVADLGVNAAHGSQSVVLQPGVPPAQITQVFAPFVPPAGTPNIIFVDFYAKPVAEADVTTATTFNIGSARFAFVLNGGQGILEAFNGNGSGGGTWSSTNFSAPLAAGNQSQNWIHLTARLDFTQGKWDLYASGAMVAADLGFLDSTSTMLTSFSVQGDAATASEVDDILAGTNNPLFADVNNDGIDDAWEQKYGLSLSTNDRYLDPTNNGQTVLYDYINGLDPTDYYGGVLPVLTSLVDPSGVPGAQGLVSVKLTRASDGSVLANAPITLAVTTGASQISSTAGGPGSMHVSVLTNASGIAQAYVNFTSFAADVLVATAQSGSQTASISINIYPANPNGQGPLNLIAGGDAVLWQDASNVTRLWGRNNDGQLGDGTVISRSQMSRISGITQPLISAALGEGHGLAVTNSGQVYTWGDNYFGQLGDGTTASHDTPAILTGLTGIIQVAAGDGHSLALKSDGTVWAWGGNQSGQLGDGTTVNRSAPVQIPGLGNIVQVVAGARHSAALDKNGAVWVWGSNEFGQLGGGAAIANSSTPIALTGLGTTSSVSKLVSGRQFLLALKADGTVWAWGDNHAGQLGVGTTSTVTLPQLNPTLSGIKALAAGSDHAVALDGNGNVWTWGANDSGQLGNGTNVASATPVSLGLTGVQAVAAGYDQVVVINAAGALEAWGLNTFGQLGNSTANTFSNVPIAVAPPNN